TRFFLGCSAPGKEPLQGSLSDTRVWERALDEAEIRSAHASRRGPSDRDGPVSEWKCRTMKGKTAFDTQDVNHLDLPSNEMWRLFPDTALLQLYVNGELVTEPERPSVDEIGGYGDEQLTFASLLGGTTGDYVGAMDDVRIWSTARTA